MHPNKMQASYIFIVLRPHYYHGDGELRFGVLEGSPLEHSKPDQKSYVTFFSRSDSEPSSRSLENRTTEGNSWIRRYTTATSSVVMRREKVKKNDDIAIPFCCLRPVRSGPRLRREGRVRNMTRQPTPTETLERRQNVDARSRTSL